MPKEQQEGMWPQETGAWDAYCVIPTFPWCFVPTSSILQTPLPERAHGGGWGALSNPCSWSQSGRIPMLLANFLASWGFGHTTPRRMRECSGIFTWQPCLVGRHRLGTQHRIHIIGWGPNGKCTEKNQVLKITHGAKVPWASPIPNTHKQTILSDFYERQTCLLWHTYPEIAKERKGGKKITALYHVPADSFPVTFLCILIPEILLKERYYPISSLRKLSFHKCKFCQLM
jgi:hypothetical protein